MLENIEKNESCKKFNCTSEIYQYYKENKKCPDDSQEKDIDESEKDCCKVDKKCECQECKPKSEQVDLCKAASQNFEAVLVQKGESLPAKCCDVFICREFLQINFIQIRIK